MSGQSDLIDRKELLSKSLFLTCEQYTGISEMPYEYIQCISVARIKNAPVVEMPVIHGRWIKTSFWDFCSMCNAKFDVGLGMCDRKYCPDCGKKMDKEDLHNE